MVTPTNPPPMPQASQQQPHMNHQTVRRASDPVRTLDRNFGMDGQLSRHQRRGSYNNQINMGHQQQRVPLHGQRIRGMSGDTYFHQQQVMPQTNPSMYPPQRMAAAAAGGNGSFPTPNQGNQFPPPAYNNNQMQQPNYPGWQNNQCVGQQQSGQNPGFQANFPGYPQAQQPSSNNNFAEYNNGQWPGNAQWNGWNPGTAATGTAPQQPAGVKGAPNANPANVGPSCDNSSNSYQRTFDYVQQCQSWTAQ